MTTSVSHMAALFGPRIRHSVAFTLHHAEGSVEEASFFEALRALAAIAGVEAFEVVAEVSPKNAYQYGVSMEFADRAAYDAYNAHPDHIAFVTERWTSEVADFLGGRLRCRGAQVEWFLLVRHPDRVTAARPEAAMLEGREGQVPPAGGADDDESRSPCDDAIEASRAPSSGCARS